MQTAKAPRLEEDTVMGNAPMEEAASSHVDQLQSLLASYYPQYARVNYIPVPVDNNELVGSEALSKSQLHESSIRYRCQVTLFEMLIETRDLYLTFEEAKEAAAKVALDLLAEFNNVIRSRSTEARFGRLFQPLVEEMTKGLATTTSMIDPLEQQKVDQGHAPVISVEYYKGLGTLDMQKSLFTSKLAACYEKMSAAGIPAKMAKVTPNPPKQNVAVTANTTEPSKESFDDSLVDPLSAIHQHFQKQGGTCAAPDFEFFDGKTRNMFGCIGKYQGQSYVAPGTYKTKKDAKRAAAILICRAIFGTSAPVASIDTVVETNDTVIARSSDVKGSIVTVNSGQATPVERIEPSTSKLELEPPAGKRFVSIINECCQVNRLPQPDYQCQTGDSINSYYVMHLSNPFNPATIRLLGGTCSDDQVLPKRFVSAPFTKKADAKEDCAGRVFVFLKEQSVFDENGALHKRQPAQLNSRSNRQDRYFDQKQASQQPSTPYNRPNQNHQQQMQHPQQQNFMPTLPQVPHWPPQNPAAMAPLSAPFPFPPMPMHPQQQNPMYPNFPPMPPPPFMMFPPLMSPPAVLDPNMRQGISPTANQQQQQNQSVATNPNDPRLRK